MAVSANQKSIQEEWNALFNPQRYPCPAVHPTAIKLSPQLSRGLPGLWAYGAPDFAYSGSKVCINTYYFQKDGRGEPIVAEGNKGAITVLRNKSLELCEIEAKRLFKVLYDVYVASGEYTVEQLLATARDKVI